MKSKTARPIFLALISCFFVLSGQVAGKTPSSAAPHIVRILLDSAAARQFRPGFATLRAGQPDIQGISLNDSSAIESVLQLPRYFHIVSLKPYLPEHSVVFEDIREHINPELFRKNSVQSLSINNDVTIRDNYSLFQSSEDRLSRWFILRYSDSISPEDAAKLCRKSHEIEMAEPLYPATPQYVPDTPNDSLLSQQYALPEINAFNAWGVVTCDSTMVVADVDVGVDITHPDLVAAIWHNPGEMGIDDSGNPKDSNGIDDDSDGFVDDWRGWDFAGFTDNYGIPGNDPTAMYPHGTYTSGLLAATGNNQIGIAGVAFGAKMIPVKTSAFDDPGEKMFYVFPGIVFAADHGARVINCSFGYEYESAADEDVINYAYAKGSVVAVAADNDGGYDDRYPASYRNAFSVEGVNATRNTLGWTYNRNVSVSAPGIQVVTLDTGNDYDLFEGGTSLACPEAAGGIALVMESAIKGPLHAKYPNITAGQAMAQLRATTTPINDDPNPGFNGTGVIDLFNAVTDTNAHALRVESVDIINGTSDGFLTPGQNATLRIHFKNYLAPITNVKAAIEFLDSNGNQYDPVDTGVVHSNVTSLSIGALATLGDTANDPSLFPIAVDNAAPAGSMVLIKLIYKDSEADYFYNDYDYITLKIAPQYLTIDTNNVFVSIYGNGNIGHNYILADESPTNGDGFGWEPSPQGVYTGNRDLLYNGGLMIAVDTNRIAEAMGFIMPNQSGFSNGPISRLAITKPAPGGEVATSFSATLKDSIVNSSLMVDENAYEFTDPAAADAMILDYNFHGGQNLGTVNAGIYMDWDLGDGGFNNYAAFGDSDGITIPDSVFIINRLDPKYPVVAMKVIALPAGSALNYYAMDADVELYSTGGIPTPNDEWRMLTTIKPNSGNYGDIVIALGAKNITLPSSGGVHLTYAIGLGSSEDSARSALASAVANYNGTESVSIPASQNGSIEPSLEIWPDPAERELNISLSSIAPGEMLTMKFTDAIGRKIMETTVQNGGEISIENIPSGIYLLEADCQNNRYVRTFVKE